MTLGQGFGEYAKYHGLASLVARQLAMSRMRGQDVNNGQRSALELRDETALELIRKHELIRVLDALSRSGIVALLLKGAALAYSIYSSPALRPRCDTDLLFSSADLPSTFSVLSSLGYERVSASGGEFLTYQCNYTRQDRFGVDHLLDVHWRVSNTQMFSQALDYEELLRRSVPEHALGENARVLAFSDALLLACMHRVHHVHSPYRIEGLPHVEGERLIWLYDIHLLVGAMSEREIDEFYQLTASKRMRAICRDGISRARECFGTRISGLLHLLLADSELPESSGVHLRTGGIRHTLTEITSLPRWRDRFKLLGEHLFPPRNYMREQYSARSPLQLPMLYLHRIIRGTWKRIANQ